MRGEAAVAAIIPHPLDAVIFDMDGLLLDTERLFGASLLAAGGALGLPVDEAAVHSLVGIHREGCEVLLRERYGPDFPLDAFYAESERRFAESCTAGVPLRPGVVRLLDRLRDAAIPCAVATSTRDPRATEHLRDAGLLGYFATVVTRSDVTCPKPDPEPYLLAAERLGVRPAHCVALEDSHNGVRAAAAAGMATIMIPDLLPPTAETHGLVRATLASLDEVVELLVDAA